MLLCPVESSPWRMSFGMWLSSMRRKWRCLSRVYMVGRPARDRTSTLVTLSCHDMPKMRRMLLTWKVLSLFSCLACVVHVSLPYNKVLRTQALYTAIFVFMVSLVFDHTQKGASVCCSRLSNPLIDLSVQGEVDPRYVNRWTESSLKLLMVVAGADGASCPIKFVFFRLIVRPKSLQASEKRLFRDCISCWVWAAIAASSANSMSLVRALRTFVLALRWARLNNLQSDLVHR